MTNLHIGILCAMPEEIGSTTNNLQNLSEKIFGDLRIYSGELYFDKNAQPPLLISVAWSGWGKVSAARAATRLIGSTYQNQFIDLLLFTGVAGSAISQINQWDIVVPSELVQHDMDARPIFKKYVIPALEKSKINPMKHWVQWATKVLRESIAKNEIKPFLSVSNGLIATGDRFIADKNVIQKLSKELPGLCAVEMEGAAVAQVAYQEKIPWLIVRVISDGADNSAEQTFVDFLKNYQRFSWDLIHALLKRYRDAPWDKKV